MTTLMKRPNEVERVKMWRAAGVSGAGIVIVLLGAPVLGVLALAGGAYLGWDWLKYRGKHGMRF